MTPLPRTPLPRRFPICAPMDPGSSRSTPSHPLLLVLSRTPPSHLCCRRSRCRRRGHHRWAAPEETVWPRKRVHRTPTSIHRGSSHPALRSAADNATPVESTGAVRPSAPAQAQQRPRAAARGPRLRVHLPPMASRLGPTDQDLQIPHVTARVGSSVRGGGRGEVAERCPPGARDRLEVCFREECGTTLSPVMGPPGVPQQRCC